MGKRVTGQLPEPEANCTAFCQRCGQGFAGANPIRVGLALTWHMEHHALDCFFCEKVCGGFEELAEHVKTAHGAVARKAYKRGKWTEEDMPRGRLPEPESGRNAGSGRSKKLPEPEAGDFNPWLTVEDLGKSQKGTLKLTGQVRDSSSQYGDGVVVEVKMGNKIFDWTIRYKSGNYPRLYKKFGADPAKWRGTVNVEVKEFSGNDYIAVV